MKDIKQILSELLQAIPLYKPIRKIFKPDKKDLCSCCKNNESEVTIEGKKFCINCIKFETGNHNHKRRR